MAPGSREKNILKGVVRTHMANKEYMALETDSDEELEKLIESLKDEFGDEINVSRSGRLAREEVSSQEEGSGYAFEIPPEMVEYAPFALHFALMAFEQNYQEKVVGRIQEWRDSVGFSVSDSKQMVEDPAEWLGSEVWNSLAEDVRANLQEACEAFDQGLFRSTIRETIVAVEHHSQDWCTEQLGVEQGDVWTLDAEALEPVLSTAQAKSIVSKLDYLNAYRQLVNERQREIKGSQAFDAVHTTKLLFGELDDYRSA